MSKNLDFATNPFLIEKIQTFFEDPLQQSTWDERVCPLPTGLDSGEWFFVGKLHRYTSRNPFRSFHPGVRYLQAECPDVISLRSHWSKSDCENLLRTVKMIIPNSKWAAGDASSLVYVVLEGSPYYQDLLNNLSPEWVKWMHSSTLFPTKSYSGSKGLQLPTEEF